MFTLEQASETVREVYRGLLGREADAHGVHVLGEGLHQGAPLAMLLRDFLASAEFQHRESAQAVGRLLRTGTEPGAVIQHVMSLGIACFTSEILRRGGLRRFSGPFDWLFSSSRMVEHILSDNFRTFLDAAQLAALPPSEPGGAVRCQHLLYRDISGFPDDKPIFNHHDPAGDPGHRAYFERCIGRMRQVFHGGTGSLLLQLVSVLPDTALEFRSLAAVIDRIAPAAHLRTVAISAPTGRMTPGATVWDEVGRHRLIYFEPVTPLGDLGFRDPVDDLVLLRVATSGFSLSLP